MKTKHTKGPWHLSNPKFVGKWSGFNTNQGKCYGIYATNEDLEAIAIVPKDWMLTAKEQDNEANAKLIAAAPDLFEAAKRAAKFIFDTYAGDYHQTPWKDLVKAIKKATN